MNLYRYGTRQHIRTEGPIRGPDTAESLLRTRDQKVVRLVGLGLSRCLGQRLVAVPSVYLEHQRSAYNIEHQLIHVFIRWLRLLVPAISILFSFPSSSSFICSALLLIYGFLIAYSGIRPGATFIPIKALSRPSVKSSAINPATLSYVVGMDHIACVKALI